MIERRHLHGKGAGDPAAAGQGAAALPRQRRGQVTLLEKLISCWAQGLVGGIMCNNGRYTQLRRPSPLGAANFQIADAVARHRNLDFPGHKHAFPYDVTKIEPAVRSPAGGDDIQLETRAGAVEMEEGKGRIKGLRSDRGQIFAADVFVETTGTAGPQVNCLKYGNGCAMCILRCPSSGPRVSIAAKAGIQEMIGGSSVGTLGAMSGSCKLLKESLAHGIQERLNREGVVVVPLPPELQKKDLRYTAV